MTTIAEHLGYDAGLAQGPLDRVVSRLDDMLFDNLPAIADGQPGNSELIAAYNAHVKHPSADTFAALVECRNSRTTWFGKDELSLRSIIDEEIRSPAKWIQPRPLTEDCPW